MAATNRPLPLFTPRTLLAPTVGTGLLSLAVFLPLTFVLAFGLLPPFWLGDSRGILTETVTAYSVVFNLVWNEIVYFLQPFVPFFSLPTAFDYIPDLQNSPGVLAELWLRAGTTLGAVVWAVSLLTFRCYRRTDPVPGYEYIGGPRLWEGLTATRRAVAAKKPDDKMEKTPLFLAPDLPLSTKQQNLSFAYIGRQGSGKSTTLRFLMQQLIERHDTKLIVLDQQGDVAGSWPNDDVIFFAPHDCRSHAWDIGADIATNQQAQEFAVSLVEKTGGDSVWPDGARIIIQAVIVALQLRHGTNWGFVELVDALQLPPLELRDLVKPVSNSVLNYLSTDHEGEYTRTAIGFVTNFQAAVLPLLRPLALSWGALPKAKRVSLTQWLLDDTPSQKTLILQNSTDFPDITAAWMRQVIQKLVRISGSSGYGQNKDKRLWFLLDEFPQLGELPDLLIVPETHRKNNVTLLVTMQSISQIYSTYGKDDADGLLSGLKTKVILRPGQGSDLVAMINKWLGKLRYRDPRESWETEKGTPKSLPEHEADLITAKYLEELGLNKTGVDGLILGIGADAYRFRWPLQFWPKQRPGTIPAAWSAVKVQKTKGVK